MYGSRRSDISYSAIELGLFPCATRFEFFNGSVSGGHDDCEWDQKKEQEYLKSAPSALLLYNQIEFVEYEYWEIRLLKKAQLHTKLFYTDAARSGPKLWISYPDLEVRKVNGGTGGSSCPQKFELEDETDYFQLGLYDLVELYQVQFGLTDPSSFNTWPTKQKQSLFKFDSFYIENPRGF